MKKLLLVALCGASLLAVARAEEGKMQMGSKDAMHEGGAMKADAQAHPDDAMAPHQGMKADHAMKRPAKKAGRMAKHDGAMKHEGAMKPGEAKQDGM